MVIQPEKIGIALIGVLLLVLISSFIGQSSVEVHDKYDRQEWGFKGYVSELADGKYRDFYTNELCDTISIDHVVSLKDAHESGGKKWSKAQKRKFANDRDNHVASCTHINNDKGNKTPEEFTRDYGNKIVRQGDYEWIYYGIKRKYGLSK